MVRVVIGFFVLGMCSIGVMVGVALAQGPSDCHGTVWIDGTGPTFHCTGDCLTGDDCKEDVEDLGDGDSNTRCLCEGGTSQAYSMASIEGCSMVWMVRAGQPDDWDCPEQSGCDENQCDKITDAHTTPGSIFQWCECAEW